MTEVKKEQAKEERKAEDENAELDSKILKDMELDKEGDNLDDDDDIEYHRRSFHAREYKSATIEQTQREVEELIVKVSR